MKNLGKFITRGFWQASLCAFVFALLPLLGWLAIVIIALVSLRKGPQQGFLVLLWACLPSIAMAIDGWHGSTVQVMYFCTSAFSVWLMALLLRRTSSWAVMLQVMMVIGVMAVLVLHSFYPDLVKQMQSYFGTALMQANLKMAAADKSTMIALWSQSVVRLLVVSILSLSCLWLVLGRWWQAVLFNPGMLHLELHNIRLNKYVALVLVILMAALLLVRTPWLMDIFPVVMLPFSIAGLSLVHSFIAAKKIHTAWMVVFYIILVLAMGVLSSFLAVVAILDSWFNLRQRWQITRG